VTAACETVYVDRGEGRPRLLLRILGRRQEDGYTVLELAPPRHRCRQGGCRRYADVPQLFCADHERRTA
jgi:hypothetical protein